MTQEFSVLSTSILPPHSGKEAKALAMTCNVWRNARPHWPIAPKETIHFYHWAFFVCYPMMSSRGTFALS